MGDWEWKLTIEPRRKGGPGSGNWGHAGRPGQVGGSAPGGGAAYAREKYLKAIRDGYPRPVRDEIAKSIQAIRPDATEDQVDMYLDVMAMDRERFLYYGNKIGLDNPERAADAYFAENEAMEKDVLRRRLAMEDAATFSTRGQPQDQLDAYGKIWDGYRKVRKGTAQELAGIIKERFGVEFQNDSGVSDEFIRKHASHILNVADAHPAIAKILKEQVKRIQYTENPRGDTAAAEWNLLDTVKVYQHDFAGPGLFVHELGHAAEAYAGSLTELNAMGFGRGRTATAYGWKNHHEDWAEWFVSVIDNEPGIAAWEPAKFAHVRDLIERLGG